MLQGFKEFILKGNVIDLAVAVVIGAAAATDFLDGWVARRVRATSRWGALLDPIADRVFVLTVVGEVTDAHLAAAREAAETLLRHAAEYEATVAREGIEFGEVDIETELARSRRVLDHLAERRPETYTMEPEGDPPCA